MSRIANNPIEAPKGVELKIDGQLISVKGSKGEQSVAVHDSVEIVENEGQLTFAPRAKTKESHALSGTMRALVNNAIVGVSQGFEKKLQLIGVGYRAKASGKSLDLTLGFSHPVVYQLPEGVKADTPSQTEIVLTSSDKQILGQAAAEIRAFRPPEPYKGKGVRYADERVITKEAKKK